MSRPQAILIVEDESIVALDLKHQLLELGYTVTDMAPSGEEAIQSVERRPPDLILMDVRLQGDIDGITSAERIRSTHDIPMIFLTSHSDDETVRRAAKTGPYGYLTKPYQPRELRAGIEVALVKADLERQLDEANQWFTQTLQWVTDGIVVTDLDARITVMNPAAESLTGWTSQAARGRVVGEVVKTLPPEPADGAGGAIELPLHRYDATAMVRAALELDRPTPIAHGLRLLGQHGEEATVDQTVGPVDGRRGPGLGAVLLLHDASFRIAQEHLLRHSDERLRKAFDASMLGMAVVSMAGEILEINQAMYRFLGGKVEDLKHRSHDDLLVEPLGAEVLEQLAQVRAGARSEVQFQTRYRRLVGADPAPAEVRVSPLANGARPTNLLYQLRP